MTNESHATQASSVRIDTKQMNSIRERIHERVINNIAAESNSNR